MREISPASTGNHSRRIIADVIRSNLSPEAETMSQGALAVTEKRQIVRQAVAYGLALLLVRALQLVAIGRFTGATEFADDIGFQRVYAADPLQLLFGRSTTFEVFPPLFPIAIWLVYTPLSAVLPPFFAMRMTMCVFEVIAWPLVWLAINHTAKGRARHLLAATYVAAPVCWITTVNMCEDEVISMAFFAAVVLALLKNRNLLALFLCGAGVVVAKIYFLVPLVALVAFSDGRAWRDWLKRICVGVAPIAVVYGLQIILTGRLSIAADAFSAFVVPYEMSVNIWGFIYQVMPIGAELARRISSVIALLLGLLPLLIVRWRRTPPTGEESVRTIVAMMLWVFFAFYHINAEYYLIVVPGVLLALPPGAASLVLLLGFSLPWAVNFFYGVRVGMARGDAGRAAFVRVYEAIFSVDPAVPQSICMVLVSAGTLALAVYMTWPRTKSGMVSTRIAAQ